jgi:hypothetical protein
VEPAAKQGEEMRMQALLVKAICGVQFGPKDKL